MDAYRKMYLLFVGFIHFAIVFATFMFPVRNDEFITCLAEASTLADTLFVPPFQLMVGET
jgi:hypothetical protein